MQLPLHLIISEKLRQQIANGEYQPSEQLPSEHQLMTAFKVSRITVRRAIANLVSQGLVTSRQGKGVFVAQHQKVTYSLSNPLIFLEEDMARQGIQFATRNLVFKLVTVPQDVQQMLKLPPQKNTAYLQKKVLLMNGVPGGMDITYILPELGKAFAKDLKRQMTFPTLEQNGILIERIDAILECTHADREVSQYLDVPIGHPLIVYRHTAYTQGDRPVVHGESISRADRFCYSVTVQKTAIDYL
jgi:GntR family transcriptional regulator